MGRPLFLFKDRYPRLALKAGNNFLDSSLNIPLVFSYKNVKLIFCRILNTMEEKCQELVRSAGKNRNTVIQSATHIICPKDAGFRICKKSMPWSMAKELP